MDLFSYNEVLDFIERFLQKMIENEAYREEMKAIIDGSHKKTVSIRAIDVFLWIMVRLRVIVVFLQMRRWKSGSSYLMFGSDAWINSSKCWIVLRFTAAILLPYLEGDYF